MADSETQKRLANLQSIIKWSLRQIDDPMPSSEKVPLDPERRKWLEEALGAIAGGPSETDFLKAALSILRTHRPPLDSELSEEAVMQLTKAFEEVEYYIEDLDHANDLIPLGGVAVIVSYLSHPNAKLQTLACSIIGTACQNHLKTQVAFIDTGCLSRLVAMVKDKGGDKECLLKAMYAISCLVRECDKGLVEFLKLNGLAIYTDCLQHELKKCKIKALFLLSSILAIGTVREEAEKSNMFEVLKNVLKCEKDVEIKEVASSALFAYLSGNQSMKKLCLQDREFISQLESISSDANLTESLREACLNIVKELNC